MRESISLMVSSCASESHFAKALAFIFDALLIVKIARFSNVVWLVLRIYKISIPKKLEIRS